MSRPEARAEALQAIYGAEQRNDAILDLEGLSARAGRLALAVWECREELDESLGAVSGNWRVERMSAIDRNVLRIGLYELRHRPELPIAVAIITMTRV